jgi:hypothetical protein
MMRRVMSLIFLGMVMFLLVRWVNGNDNGESQLMRLTSPPNEIGDYVVVGSPLAAISPTAMRSRSAANRLAAF